MRGAGGRKAQNRKEIYIHIHKYTYGQFTLLFGRNSHNMVKELYPNLKNKIKIPLMTKIKKSLPVFSKRSPYKPS